MEKDPTIYVRHMLEAIGNIEATVLWDTCDKDLKPLKDAVERIGAFMATTKDDANDTK
jgi:uncharacterized protein with HEPN domain